MNARALARTLVLSAFVVLAVGAAVASAATVRVGSETIVCGVPGDQVSPEIHGDDVVWEDYRNGNWDIYAKNLSTGVESPVCVESQEQNYSDIFGDDVVWEDYRNGNWDIYTRNLSTEIESPVCTEPHTQGFPAVYGDVVVWVDSRNGNSDIYMKDLSTGVESPVCTDSHEQIYAAISGDIVVWRDERNGNYDIYMKDLSTGTESPVCAESHAQTAPSIFGDIVTWGETRNGNYDIYMKDLSTGIESPVCVDPAEQFAKAVFGDLVVWEDARNGGWDLYMKDVSTGVESPVCVESHTQRNPVVYGHVVVWWDERGMAVTSCDIYSARIDGPATRLTSLEGANRYGTAVAACEDAYRSWVPLDREGYRTVVIATGRNFPDALGASALAGVLDSPVLITDTNALPASVGAEIARLHADRAIIVGGTDVVGAGVETALGLAGITKIERVEGRTRYETADAVARACEDIQGSHYEGVCFVATGRNFPDALAAAPVAAAHGWPIFLAGPSGLSAATLQAMTDIGVTEAHILGGPDAVSSQVEATLRTKLGTSNVVRHYGDTRYETAVSVARFGVDGAGMQWDGLAIATGENFPDALCGGALQARQSSVLLLTKGTSLPTLIGSRLSTERDYIARVKFLGGTDVVSPEVRDSVMSRLH